MSKSIKELISGVIYTEFDDMLGPNPVGRYPDNIDSSIQMLIAIKVITLLTGEETFIPKDLVVVPFPSLNSKGLVNYIEWKDENRRGGIARAAITLLFEEFDDLIFYQYRADLTPIFQECSEKLLEIELKKEENPNFNSELSCFHDKVVNLLEDLRNKELAAKQAEAFPEEGADAFDYRFKVIVVGDPSVGKTSTVLRFTYNAFTRTYMPTIGTSISEKSVKIGNNKVNLIIWDVAGQSKFKMMRRHFYQGAESVLMVYDLTVRKTFESMRNWIADIKKSLKSSTLIISFMIGNKNDLEDERQVSREEAEALAQELGVEYLETSALTGENINEVFHKIAKAVLEFKTQ
ncbi:MAG: Rab family GTPase [Promethearchaeota archaeon]